MAQANLNSRHHFSLLEPSSPRQHWLGWRQTPLVDGARPVADPMAGRIPA